MLKDTVRRILVTLFSVACLMGADGLPAASGPVTFSKDIAPILQRSCQNCHQPDSVAPMSLITYKDVRPWAKSIKARTLLRDKPGVLPPWYVDKDIGIQHYKNHNSLSELHLPHIANQVGSGD